MANEGPISADRLKSYIERIERLEEEQAAIAGDKRDVYSEAKGVGYDTKTMRKIVQLRKQDAADREEAQTLLDTYMHALGMESGGGTVVLQPSEEELEERASRIVSEVERCIALAVDGKPPKIAAIQRLIGCSAGKAHKLRGFVVDRISRSTAPSVKNEKAEAVSAGLKVAAEKLMADGTVSIKVNAEPGSVLDTLGAALEEVAPGCVERNVTVGADDGLDIPAFLDRRKQATT